MESDASHIRQNGGSTEIRTREKTSRSEDFVLEKSIFSNIFEKDIRRVYIYKKAERLAKAIHMVSPAFAESMSLKNRADAIALGLVDAAVEHPLVAREALSKQLLALSSLLSIARIGGLLSAMNADLISHEAQNLLQEIASYEEPRLFLEDAPTLAELARRSGRREELPRAASPVPRAQHSIDSDKGQVKDTRKVSDRRDVILSVIKDKPNVSIKDISTVIRGVSEKTVQRELQALINEGVVKKQGERRWSTYSLA